MDALRVVREAAATAAANVREAIKLRRQELTDEVLAAVKGDTGTNASAIRIAQTAEALSNTCKTLNEMRDASGWSNVAEQWRNTANLRGQLSPAEGRKD
jgi:hypothetical protein